MNPLPREDHHGPARPRLIRPEPTARVGTWIVVLFLLAAGLRVGWVLVRWGPPGRAEQLKYPDEEAYELSARSLASGAGLIDEFRFRATYMPGYPAFLAAFQRLPRPLLWARIIQSLLAAWVAPATFLLARRALHGADGTGAAAAGGERVVPLLAGLAAAFDPFLIFFSGLLLTEALFAAALVTAWFFFMKRERRSFLERLCGPLFLWLCVMLRPSAAVLVALTPIALPALRRFNREAIIQAVMIPGVVLIGLFPWAARNRMIIGEWRWLSTRGGISLYDGLHGSAAGGSDLADTKALPAVRGLSEIEWDAYFTAAARDEARRDPARVVRLAGRKLLRTWSLTPNVEEYHGGPVAMISAAWMLPALILAGLGWWRRRREVAVWAMLLLPVVAFTLLHMIYVGSVRYRVPVMPFVLVLAAAGLRPLLDRMCRLKEQRA